MKEPERAPNDKRETKPAHGEVARAAYAISQQEDHQPIHRGDTVKVDATGAYDVGDPRHRSRRDGLSK